MTTYFVFVLCVTLSILFALSPVWANGSGVVLDYLGFAGYVISFRVLGFTVSPKGENKRSFKDISIRTFSTSLRLYLMI